MDLESMRDGPAAVGVRPAKLAERESRRSFAHDTRGQPGRG